ncbi:MAG: XRE family transcriptional regulator [Candidatus Methanoperedens sp.]|nr:XRE family transcriptional regulator [Candidatus Methanoperedens sp.]
MISANINPDLLIWARKAMGFEIEETAKKIPVKTDVLEKWESGEKKPTINQLRKIANVYKRSLAVFFLSKSPPVPKISNDFRLLPESIEKKLSPRILTEIRLCNRKREIALELAKMTDLKIENELSIAHLDDDIEKLAQRERDFINIDIQTQFNLKDVYTALKLWKNVFETKGILVFQSTGIPVSDMRGYSYFDKEYPFIIINSNDTPNARIFSLFHEYCHLLLRNGGICDMYEPMQKGNIYHSELEIFCNRFAAAFLIPKNKLMDESIVKANSNPNKWSDDSIQKLSHKYKVSREVIIRRLTTLNRATIECYREKHTQYSEEAKRLETSNKEIIVPQYRKAMSRNGEMYTSLVIESFREKKINMSDVADYLGIRLKHLPRIESEIMNTKLSSSGPFD